MNRAKAHRWPSWPRVAHARLPRVFVLEDKQRGVWLRLQDDADRALAPFIFEVAAEARDTVSKEVGIDLPRPLRIDLVRDLFSLSSVSGLPLKAAETTGTLAVARWGRVIMLSPRAPVQGLPMARHLGARDHAFVGHARHA
ncbi:MAG: hypothetical protein WDO74_31185 [Pseudomonadota bacterium]